MAKKIKMRIDNAWVEVVSTNDVSESADGGKIVKRDSAGNIRANYVYSTWLLTTSATTTTSTSVTYAVIDNSGWVYKKTADQMKTALGIKTITLTDNGDGTVDLSIT